MPRYRFAIGNSYNGAVELLLEVEAERKGEATSRAADLLAKSWAGVELELEGLREGESARLQTNPAYWPDPELMSENQMVIGEEG